MPHSLTDSGGTDRPLKIWLVMGYRTGECSQILALAEALGLPFELKRIVYKKSGFVANLTRRVTLAGIVKRKSSPLLPPWPDLVISAGLRNEPVCRWIKEQEGNTTRLVHIGRPWAGLKHFDLVITTPQYRLPAHPNVLQNETTLHRVTERQLTEAATLWAPRFAHLPRPYIAVVAGGDSGPYTFDRRAAERLGREASAMASAVSGALLVTTSARTPQPSIESLSAAITAPAHLFRWKPDAADNPYFGYLALADSIIVTGDSIAMLTEACATRKPVYLFDLGEGPNSMRPSPTEQSSRHPYPRGWQHWGGSHWKAFLYGQMMRIGPRRLSRDIRIVHQYLISSGRAVWLGQSFPPGSPPPLKDLQRAVTRVWALFDPVTAEHGRSDDGDAEWVQAASGGVRSTTSRAS